MTDIEGFDPILAVETLYQTGLSSEDWLSAVMKSLKPLLDPEHNGLFGGFYQCEDPTAFRAPSILTMDCSDRLLSTFHEGMSSLNENFVAGSFVAPGITRSAAVEGWDDIPQVRNGAIRALGFVDNRCMVSIDPAGNGLCLAVFHKQPAVLRGVERVFAGNMCRHLLAAHRLQRRLQGCPASPGEADAILDPNGQLHHVRGPAANPEARQGLERAVRASEQSRGARRRQDPLRALNAWESLVMGRWTFVDHFDHDGRRYILALENAREDSGLALLSPRELEVVEQALLGSHNKAIAYDLRLSHSTVRVLMSRAAFKLRVRTRHALLTKIRALRNGRH